MEERKYHYHVDLFCINSGKAHFIRQSRALPKRIAIREFERTVEELRLQVGKFQIRKAGENDRESFPGSLRIAQNHLLVVVLSRCDCDEH